MRVYVATHTGPIGGIALFDLDLATGALASRGMAIENVPANFLILDPTHTRLYAVGQKSGEQDGTVSALSIDKTSDKLTLLNQQPSGGNGPCHLALDRNARNLLIANYGGGTIAVLPVDEDGKLRAPTTSIKHQGTGPNPKRQEHAHPHWAGFDPTKKLAMWVDLGTDKVHLYDFGGNNLITPHAPATIAVEPGFGPRHLDFHPNGRFMYVVNELKSFVDFFTFDAATTSFLHVQTIGTLPQNFTDTNYPAEVQVHPSGKFLYASNRGHDSIAIFAIDQSTGRLTALGHQSCAGHWPRQFAVDPTGQYLINGNERSDTLVVFRINQTSGALTQLGEPITLKTPFCVTFVPTKR